MYYKHEENAINRVSNSNQTSGNTHITLGRYSLGFCLAGILGACGSDGSTINTRAVNISETGKFELTEEFDRSISEPILENDIPAGEGIIASCSTEDWEASKVRELTNVVGLDLNGTTLYPGALLQGSYYQDGLYVPITIPRSTGTIYMTGLNLEPGSEYFADNIEMTGAGVNQAIKQIITDNGIQGTSANASYQEEQTYNYENMLFELGIDARYGLASMAADLSIDSTKSRNYSFVKFTQIFYNIIYEDPALATSVFRDGASYQDTEGQIAEGNPPLYVSKVSYGRMVFFVAESTHDAKEVEVALSAAVRGGVGSGRVESGLTYEEVLGRSNVYYYAIGGAADLALAPIRSASPEDMFDAVKNFIADPESANFSASNPGAPIAYTLNYLSDRSPARMSYSVNYNKKDCEFIRANTIPTGEKLKISFERVDMPDDCDGVGKGAGEISGRFDIIYYNRENQSLITERVATLTERKIHSNTPINLNTLRKFSTTINHYYGDTFELSARLDEADPGGKSQVVGLWNANVNDLSRNFGPGQTGAKTYKIVASRNCNGKNPTLTMSIVKQGDLF